MKTISTSKLLGFLYLTVLWWAGANSQEKSGITLPRGDKQNAAFQIPWLSINRGGDLNLFSPNFRAKATAGQSIIGTSQSANYRIRTGFWYGASCAATKGDMNASGDLTPADVVLMLNCVFLAQGNCAFCFADLNCSGDLSPADVVVELNMVFLAAPPGC